MTEDCRRRDACRLCGGRDMTLVVGLTPTPPANAFVGADAKGAAQRCFPLDVHFCESCAHVQLLDVVDPRLLFETYVYVSGTSPVLVRHFEDYAESVVGRFALETNDLVVDVGSNDGTLLKAFKARGMRVLGVDPAKDIARRASEAGIETLPEFLTPALARRIRDRHGPAKIVTANNVFAHADDLAGLRDAAQVLIEPAGAFVFEVSYLKDVIENVLFDTIYHEHLAYHSVKPLRRFFADGGMALFAAERIAVHGGSLRGMARPAGGNHGGDGDDDSVARLIDGEERAGLDRADTFRAFAGRIDERGRDLRRLVSELKADGKSLAGFGAPAKATTLMYHFGIGADVIDFIVDDNPLKQGLFTPGLHVPVLPATALYERRPDYAIVLAWNFAASIIAKHSAFRDGGGRFIVPLPQLTVH